MASQRKCLAILYSFFFAYKCAMRNIFCFVGNIFVSPTLGAFKLFAKPNSTVKSYSLNLNVSPLSSYKSRPLANATTWLGGLLRAFWGNAKTFFLQNSEAECKQHNVYVQHICSIIKLLSSADINTYDVLVRTCTKVSRVLRPWEPLILNAALKLFPISHHFCVCACYTVKAK